MSTDLYWRPVSKDANILESHLKIVLRNSGITSGIHPVKVGREKIDYLHGLKDAGIEGAEELIEIINKYGEVEIFED